MTRRPQRRGRAAEHQRRTAERPTCAPAKRVRHFPGLRAFQCRCERALCQRGETPRAEVKVTLSYHGQVPPGTRLLLVAEPHHVYAVALRYDPARQITVCQVSALAVLQAMSHPSRGLKDTTQRPQMSTRHPAPSAVSLNGGIQVPTPTRRGIKSPKEFQ